MSCNARSTFTKCQSLWHGAHQHTQNDTGTGAEVSGMLMTAAFFGVVVRPIFCSLAKFARLPHKQQGDSPCYCCRTQGAWQSMPTSGKGGGTKGNGRWPPAATCRRHTSPPARHYKHGINAKYFPGILKPLTPIESAKPSPQ